MIAGVAAPSQDELVYWLQDHPTFEVLRPSGLSNSSLLIFFVSAKVDHFAGTLIFTLVFWHWQATLLRVLVHQNWKFNDTV